MKSPIKLAACEMDGKIWTGKRHGGIIQQMVKDGVTKRIKQENQGFITEDNEFLNREEAYIRAVECNQIKDNHRIKKLLSEMVW